MRKSLALVIALGILFGAFVSPSSAGPHHRHHHRRHHPRVTHHGKRLSARPDPRETVVKWVGAVRANGGDALQALMSDRPNSVAQPQYRKDLAARYPEIKKVYEELARKLTIDVGKSTVEGDNATVPVAIGLSDPPVAPQKIEPGLTWTGGTWKLSGFGRAMMAAALVEAAKPVFHQHADLVKKIIHDLQTGSLKLPDAPK
jgi:hypothetical protein